MKATQIIHLPAGIYHMEKPGIEGCIHVCCAAGVLFIVGGKHSGRELEPTECDKHFTFEPCPESDEFMTDPVVMLSVAALEAFAPKIDQTRN